MQPYLLHYCSHCSSSTKIPFSASVFSQNIACSYCDTIVSSINVQNKKHEQANMQQDELAHMFSTHMSLAQHTSQPNTERNQHTQNSNSEHGGQAAPQPIVYASQHYTHSSHITPTPSPDFRANHTQIEAIQLREILLRNSIDPSFLFPSQIDLFQNADDDQRLRLLELWRISPPQGRQGYPDDVDYNKSRQLYDWPPTSLAQEEAMAKLRYEKTMAERTQQEEIRKHQELLEQSMDANTHETSPDRGAEPYIVSGYDMLARREYEESMKSGSNLLQESTRYNQATDPVYNSGLWQKNVGSILDMENQYGAFAQARDHDVRPIYIDDDMVM